MSLDGTPNSAHALELVQLLVFQGTPFCNIDCDYCYLADRSNRSRMSLKTVEAACRQLLQNNLVGPRPVVLWHSGEPLALPISFYEQAFAVVERELRGFPVEHRLQTNAILLNHAWIQLFKRWNVRVGVSLDGPPHFHDRHRLSRSKRPTSHAVLQGVEKLKQAGLPLRVICVLTSDSITQPDELFSFFELLGVSHVGFNIDEAGGPHRLSSHVGPDASETFYRFFRRYFELVLGSSSQQEVRELVRGLTYIFSEHHQISDEARPIRVLTISHNGDFSTFSPDLLGQHHPELGSFNLGNVHDRDAFATLRNHPRLIKLFGSVRRGIEACERTCPYFAICKGGVPASKFGEHASLEATETVACRFKRKAVADAIVALLLRNAPTTATSAH